MNEFEVNHPKRLKEFLTQLDDLIEEFHPNICLMDKLFEGVNIVREELKKELNKDQTL
jgi:Holliday junction resolvasome RuvABC endonuclease subunit